MAAGGPEAYDATPVREAHCHVPFEPRHLERAVELHEESLADAGVPEDDAELVAEAITRQTDDLPTRPEE